MTRGKPFKAGNRGRPAGSQNNQTLALKAVSERLLAAWDRVTGDGEADKIMRAALKAAFAGDFNPLRSVLPYIARKMPEATESDGREPINITFPHVGARADSPAPFPASVSSKTQGDLK